MKYEEEMRAREEVEQTLRSFRKDVDDATSVRMDLERRVESLMDEISFMRKVHDEEIQELSSMMEAQQVSVELELSKPDLTSALKEIRNQYESIASKNLQSAEEWYKGKFASLSEQASRSNEAMRASREELSEFRRQLQSKTIEIETLRGANESLERQISEMEDAHNAEVTTLQVSSSIMEKWEVCSSLHHHSLLTLIHPDETLVSGFTKIHHVLHMRASVTFSRPESFRLSLCGTKTALSKLLLACLSD